MKTPDFTDDENYLINTAKSPSATSQNPMMWGYIIGGTVLAVIAWVQINMLLLIVAFLLLAAFRVYEKISQARWAPIWRSAIQKYELTIAELNESARNEDSA